MSDVSISVAEKQSEEQQKIAKKDQIQRKRWRTNLLGLAFIAPFLIAYIMFLIWPIILGFRMSFYNWSLGKGALEFLGLGNYQELFADPAFWSSLGNTIWFTVLSTPILVLLSLGLALLVNHVSRAQWFFRTVFFAPFILPVSVITLIWGWIMQPGFGLLNGTLAQLGLQEIGWLTDPAIAMISIVLVTVWWTVGFNFVLYLAGMQQIPTELYEASAIDGANIWGQIRWITVPLLGRITAMIVILQVIASLRVFDQIYLLTAGGPNYVTRSLIQYIYDTGFTTFRIGFASAMSYVFFVIILLVSLGQFLLVWNNQRRGA